MLSQTTENILKIIKENSDKYYKYVSSYSSPRQAVLNYLICEDLKGQLKGCVIEADVKLDVDGRGRFIDMIIKCNSNELIYILLGREHGKIQMPSMRDLKKLESLTLADKNACGLHLFFLKQPESEIHILFYKCGQKLKLSSLEDKY